MIPVDPCGFGVRIMQACICTRRYCQDSAQCPMRDRSVCAWRCFLQWLQDRQKSAEYCADDLDVILFVVNPSERQQAHSEDDGRT